MEELLQQVAESAVTVQRDNRDGSTEQEEVNDTQMLINDFVVSYLYGPPCSYVILGLPPPERDSTPETITA